MFFLELVLLYILLPKSRFWGIWEIVSSEKNYTFLLTTTWAEGWKSVGTTTFIGLSRSGGLLIINFTTGEWVLNLVSTFQLTCCSSFTMFCFLVRCQSVYIFCLKLSSILTHKSCQYICQISARLKPHYPQR